MSLLGQGSRKWIRLRIGLLLIAMTVGMAAVAKGAWHLGVERSEQLLDLAEEQYERRISLPARRGMITDRHGEELAVEVEVDSVYADARQIEDPAGAAARLARYLGTDEKKLSRRLASKKHFVWLERRVTPDAAAGIAQLEIPGVRLLKESKRYYPNRLLASHVLGFAGIDAVGLEGVELNYDDQLRGRREAVTGLRDGRGHVVFADSVFGPEGVVGNTVELTIDKTLQYIAEQELAATVRTYNARAGQVVIMDPHTGELLALANWPSYNPNVLSRSDPETRRNRAVLDVFEPGSTFKIFTLAAALNSGAVRPDDLIFCERGRWEIGDTKKVPIHDDHRDGWLTPAQCLKRSSNICFAKIAIDMGKKRLYHYLRRFGFGESTRVDLPFEARGVLHHYKKWYDIDAATISFGQGVGVTGIQMTAALSAVANGGVLMKPMLVRRIVGPDKETLRTFASTKKRRVISRYTARLVGDIMTSVTEEGGTGFQGALDGFLVAGKTGTAQKSVGKTGYQDDKWVASFFGFVPADGPRLAISVVIDEPLINHYGGTVAAPALRRIADQSLRYLGVSRKNVVRRRPPERAAPEALASEPADGEAALRAPRAMEPGQIPTPDLKGMTMKQALDALSLARLRPVIRGTGFALDQLPAAFEPVEPGAFVQVNFRPLEGTSDLDDVQHDDVSEEDDADPS